MATKAELEVELALLRQQNEALRAEKGHGAKPEPTQDSATDIQLPQQLADMLKEQGIDAADVEALGNQLGDEVTKLQKDHPLLMLLSVFVLGCVVGRALR